MLATYSGQVINGKPVIFENIVMPERANFIITFVTEASAFSQSDDDYLYGIPRTELYEKLAEAEDSIANGRFSSGEEVLARLRTKYVAKDI